MSAIFILNSGPKCGLFKKSINLKSGISFDKSAISERLVDENGGGDDDGVVGEFDSLFCVAEGSVVEEVRAVVVLSLQ